MLHGESGAQGSGMDGGDDGLHPRPVVGDSRVDPKLPPLTASFTKRRDSVYVPAKIKVRI